MVKEIVLVHIPFTMGYRASGGGIRPQKMVNAFRKIGREALVIHGSHKERASLFQEAQDKVKKGEWIIKYIYSESSSNPTILTDKKNWWKFRDFSYLKWFHKKGIPIALFYRDVHWNFQMATKDYGLLKWALLKTLHYHDLLRYRSFVDLLLLPSVRMKCFVPLSSHFKVDELPPGHDVEAELSDRNLSDFPKLLYVGGIQPPVYDMTSVFRDFKNFDVTICCRKDEWLSAKDYYGPIPPNVRIIHASGEELKKELTDAHVSLMTRESHQYLSFSQPLKFYEANGYELPILASAGSLSAELIEQWGIGWVCQEIGESLNFSDYQQKLAQIRLIKPFHTWEERVKRLEVLLKHET